MTNRYHDKVVFKKIDDNTYEFYTEDDYGNKNLHIRCGTLPDGTIIYVDPPGGPMVEQGQKLRYFDKNLPDVPIKEIVMEKGKDGVTLKI